MSKIAQGGYGCVYTRGPVECFVSGDNVIKIFEKDEEEKKEWELSKILFTIDPRQRYFVYTSHRCKSSYREIRRLNVSGGECSLFTTDLEKDRIRYIHYLPNAGMTLYRYMKSSKVPFLESKKILFQICKCLQVLNSHGYVHNDIKHDNILIKANHIRLIDFGLMYEKEKYLSKSFFKDRKFLNSGYWYPPEYRWLWDLPTGSGSKFVITPERMNELIDFEISLLASPLIKRYVYSSLRELVVVYFDAIENFTIPTSLETRSKYADRSDVFALGQMISYLFLENVEFDSDSQFMFYIRLLRGMLQPDYKKRLSVNQVLKILKN